MMLIPFGGYKEGTWFAEFRGECDRTYINISALERNTKSLGQGTNCEFRLHRTYPMGDLETWRSMAALGSSLEPAA